jgi:hypothetical protein
MTERQDDEGHLIFHKIAGVVLAAILTIGGIAAIGWGDASVEPRMEAFARETPGMIFWWREDVGWLFIVGIALIFAPFVLVPGAFGVRFRRFLPTLRPRWRLVLVLGLAALISAEAVVYRSFGGRDVGVATIDGVRWLRDGALQDRWRWGQAIEITGGCSTYRKYSWSEPRYGVDYLVAFPGKRAARLSFRMEDAASWASTLKPIDDKLTAAGVKRSMGGDAECLAHYQAGMVDSDRQNFQHVLRSTD